MSPSSGHGGAGKTTLAEALLFINGVTQRMGRVEDGNTVSDFDPEEHKRGISTSLSVLPFEYEGHKINILDTPGYADFVGDVVAALRVADLVLFVDLRRGRRGGPGRDRLEDGRSGRSCPGPSSSTSSTGTGPASPAPATT